jgi:Uma2 family endonuclease
MKSAMSNASKSIRPRPDPAELPPLEPGDRLDRDEFERRYEAMPNLKKAERIEGEVIMPSPVRLRQHGAPHADVITWLGVYRAHTPGVRVADNTSIRLDVDNDPQPDATLFILPECGGQAQIDTDDFIIGSPEMLCEIAASTASIDLNKKRRVYQRNGVREYIVWRVLDDAIDWFILLGADYTRNPPDASAVYRSVCFPGLWLDTGAMVTGDMLAVLRALEQGTSSLDHAEFVKRLGLRVQGA